MHCSKEIYNSLTDLSEINELSEEEYIYELLYEIINEEDYEKLILLIYKNCYPDVYIKKYVYHDNIKLYEENIKTIYNYIKNINYENNIDKINDDDIKLILQYSNYLIELFNEIIEKDEIKENKTHVLYYFIYTKLHELYEIYEMYENKHKDKSSFDYEKDEISFDYEKYKIISNKVNDELIRKNHKIFFNSIYETIINYKKEIYKNLKKNTKNYIYKKSINDDVAKCKIYHNITLNIIEINKNEKLYINSIDEDKKWEDNFSKKWEDNLPNIYEKILKKYGDEHERIEPEVIEYKDEDKCNILNEIAYNKFEQYSLMPTSISSPKSTSLVDEEIIASTIPLPKSTSLVDEEIIASTIPLPKSTSLVDEEIIASTIPLPKSTSLVDEEIIVSSRKKPRTSPPSEKKMTKKRSHSNDEEIVVSPQKKPRTSKRKVTKRSRSNDESNKSRKKGRNR